LNEDLFDYSSYWRWNLGVYFVCGNFYKGLVNVDAIANLL
jgi:hypothetical protein